MKQPPRPLPSQPFRKGSEIPVALLIVAMAFGLFVIAAALAFR